MILLRWPSEITIPLVCRLQALFTLLEFFESQLGETWFEVEAKDQVWKIWISLHSSEFLRSRDDAFRTVMLIPKPTQMRIN